jgi:hypothetical protein
VVSEDKFEIEITFRVPTLATVADKKDETFIVPAFSICVAIEVDTLRDVKIPTLVMFGCAG